jgi:hypothetical protein
VEEEIDDLAEELAEFLTLKNSRLGNAATLISRRVI